MQKEPWQLKSAELLPYAKTRPIPCVNLPGPRSWSEADLAAYKIACARLETQPPEVPLFDGGTWSFMPVSTGSGWLWHLEEVAIHDLCFNQGNPFDPSTWGWEDINLLAVEKYAAWIKAGSEPPPLDAWQMQSGRLEVKDGHNRAAALVLCGRASTPVWVSPLIQTASGWDTLTHRLAVQEALRAGRVVPTAVLAEYPDLVA